MSQFGRPSADTYNGDVSPWQDHLGGTTDVYEEIDESVADDTTYIASQLGGASLYVCKLSDLIDPGVDTGHTFRIRARRTAGATFLTVELREAYVDLTDPGTLIDSASFTMGASFGDFSRNIAAIDAADITDYADLHLRIYPDADDVEVSFAELEIPDAVRRLKVTKLFMELPNEEADYVFIENYNKTFNENLLLEELASKEVLTGNTCVPDKIYFGGGFTNDDTNDYRSWDPATTPKTGYSIGDIQFTFSKTLNDADRSAITAVLAAHNGSNYTDEQLAEDLDDSNLTQLVNLFDIFDELDEQQEDDALRLAVRLLLRLYGESPTSLQTTPFPNAFVHSSAASAFNLYGTGDPSVVSDGDIWYNSSTGKFMKHEDGVTSELSSDANAPTIAQTRAMISLRV